ncbi:nucleoside hydrolase [Actinosynnema sp. NPDC047251]|uniref:Inosine/uridine-preferring nucleoside hydrolase n=1 Tax=Saccharothrix espanaensis (strain ATCC 51144 / DSM 44229 / JCM 9112 / NBRC 15066 / NRRL 15764) TaxID=1179773 RepID=K0KD68_SACES|nr:nucleoside hydrolase [Saccharothrix espanaensis]CCH34498.1 Inosine/uridine-preferring nucleoside hydrolase [Saccharothrix espanaensis DSM 44229]
MTTPLIIDTDPGVDDAFALALAAASPEVDLIGVTTVFGNVSPELTTRNALRVLALLDREDVPVAAGAARPLVHPQPHVSKAHGSDGLSGFADTLPEPTRGPDPRDAVTLLKDLLTAADRPVTIAPIGPLTNIALLLAAHPGLRAKIARLVVMGGGIRGGNVTAAAEFNLWCDPEAARRVLVGAEVPVTLVPMDLTRRCAVSAAWLAELGAASEVGAKLVGLTPDYLATYRKFLGWDGMALHDAVAVAEAVRPGILATRRFPVDVECAFGPGRGGLLVDERLEHADRPGIDVAVDADLDGLRGFVLDRLRALGVRQ